LPVIKHTGSDRDDRDSVPSVTSSLLASLWREVKRQTSKGGKQCPHTLMLFISVPKRPSVTEDMRVPPRK